MPYKIGLGKKRKELLQQELSHITSKIINLGVEKIILFGSLAKDTISTSSDIDLIIIKKTEKRFLDRLDEFYRYLKPEVGIDILVYTPQEFEMMKQSTQFIRSAVRGGKVLYER
jgi:predicted nucleotidyltransferase